MLRGNYESTTLYAFSLPLCWTDQHINIISISHLREDGVHRHLLLEHSASEVHLGGHVTTVNLDLADVGSLLPQLHQAHLQIIQTARHLLK